MNFLLRYLDDTFLYLPTNLTNPERLLELFNLVHPKISFTMEYNPNFLNFLSVKVYKAANNKLCTDIHYKIVDSHAYLPFHSCHPPHVIKCYHIISFRELTL